MPQSAKHPKILQDLANLKHITEARIGLQRAGSSLASKEILKFDLDHARARDAVHLPFQIKQLAEKIHALGVNTVEISSAADDRMTYLQRPDLGRKLGLQSRELLQQQTEEADICIVVGDGLSSTAIQQNALPFLQLLLPMCRDRGWTLAPIHLANQARVALADEVSEHYHAKIAIILIGERPGLSAANSMGIYMTYAPRVGRSDAERNCLSNIRPGGQSYQDAVELLVRLMDGALKMRLSGVQLKDDNQENPAIDIK
ncbi:ethanolamine ammonia-lyase subunit EutC [Thiomicrorhabdus sp.]|uniref:ethanolamine ammonia-lyase subunit EutC n=1 Tax=Thiomicrorhabdus sp. TaxID=2039724 RepID=UPI0029C6AD01|nr:ethanolamine ammonia-lyase subunit EutC [Thiomicrorhabdus sp.]